MATPGDSRVTHASDLEILVGTYEEFVLGYSLTENSEGGLALVPSFTNHSHCGSIRSIATSKRFLASGSVDESIRLFSLRDRSEHGFLQQHNGTITCLEFYHQGYMFSGSDDGNVCVWNTRTWECEKTLKAHTGGVTAISIHPSGKLALTVGKDRAMKTWNLIKGRTAYVTNIKAVADDVIWSPDGTHYAVAMTQHVHIYEVKSAGVKHKVDFKKGINFVIFLDEQHFAIGGEGPNIQVHSIENKKLVGEFKAHEKRVKAGAVTKIKEKLHLVTASNDGFIKLWHFQEEYDEEPVLVTQIDTSCRITCMSLWTESKKVAAEENDVKPISTETGNSTEAKSPQQQVDKSGKPLKSLLKRPSTEGAISIVKTTSGPFIVEPLKPKNNKRTRLSFGSPLAE